jgi:SOS-response transcriptional repressor LexA
MVQLLQNEDVDPKKFGESLTEFRKSLGLSQGGMAVELDLSRNTYAAYETGRNRPRFEVMRRLRLMGFQADVSGPSTPASELDSPIVYIGTVAAGSRANWTDPFASESMEFVPPEMGNAIGRFACRIGSDSMVPTLEPQDLCVFQRDPAPRIGAIVLYRASDGLIAVKQLKHDGQDYYLHPLNPKYEDCRPEGTCVGYLVGIVRWKGSKKTTEYDGNGIYP